VAPSPAAHFYIAMKTTKAENPEDHLPFEAKYSWGYRTLGYGFALVSWSLLLFVCVVAFTEAKPDYAQVHPLLRYVFAPIGAVAAAYLIFYNACHLFFSRPTLRFTQAGIEYRDLYGPIALTWAAILGSHSNTSGSRMVVSGIIEHGNARNPSALLVEAPNVATLVFNSTIAKHRPARKPIASDDPRWDAFGTQLLALRHKQFLAWCRGGFRPLR
jgi:hypothetical protein